MKELEEKKAFRHESLQDAETIKDYLSAITESLASGSLTFSDEDGEIQLTPNGLMYLKVTASKEDGQNRFNIRVTWQDKRDKKSKDKKLNVS